MPKKLLNFIILIYVYLDIYSYQLIYILCTSSFNYIYHNIIKNIRNIIIFQSLQSREKCKSKEPDFTIFSYFFPGIFLSLTTSRVRLLLAKLDCSLYIYTATRTKCASPFPRLARSFYSSESGLTRLAFVGGKSLRNRMCYSYRHSAVSIIAFVKMHFCNNCNGSSRALKPRLFFQANNKHNYRKKSMYIKRGGKLNFYLTYFINYFIYFTFL